jgi:hypothetical protein
LKGFEFDSAAVKAKITASDLAGASSVLKPTWVKVSGVPKEYREELVFKQASKIMGRPEEADKSALKGIVPDRVKIKCRKPAIVNCSIEFFFGDVGHYTTFGGEE